MASKQRRAPQNTASSTAAPMSASRSVAPASSVSQSGGDTDWFGQMVAGEATHQGVEKGVSRPDKTVRKGAPGAVIHEKGSAIDVYTTFEATEPSSSLKSGTAVTVLKTSDDGWMQIEYRSGKTPVTGWVESALFSDQPSLGKDDDADKKVFDDYTWKKFEGDQSTTELQGNQVEQGALGDCFLIASMNAVGSANPDFLEESVKYNAETDSYSVRFYEGQYGTPKEVWIEVDGYLPTTKDGKHAYAGSGNGGTAWGPIIEKAYAKFKGGYDIIGEGGNGRSTMAELTGNRSSSKSPSSMSEEDVIPYFEKAKKEGLAVYAGVRDQVTMEQVSPFSGTGPGAYKATLPKSHDWNAIQHGTLQIRDPEGQVGLASDNGKDGDKEADIVGRDVKDGTVTYDDNRVELMYNTDIADASKLTVDYAAHGMVSPAKQLVGNHAYSFKEVIDGKMLQFYNPWGSWQPKAITAAEFLENFDSLATNQVPKAKTAGTE